MNLSRFFSRLTAEVTGEKYPPVPPANGPTFPRRNDEEGGMGVPVPAGPRPIHGGAAAKPPQLAEELASYTDLL